MQRLNRVFQPIDNLKALPDIGLAQRLAGLIKGHAPIQGTLLLIVLDDIKQISNFAAFITGKLKVLQRGFEEGFYLMVFHMIDSLSRG